MRRISPTSEARSGRFPSQAARPNDRRGLTLIELLIVIVILTTLVSAAIPILAPTNDDRRLREASRSVNAFIAAAQMRAIQLQRPFGVALKRLSKDTERAEDNAVCVELYYVEQPLPYVGLSDTSSVRFSANVPPVAPAADEYPDDSVLVQFVSRGTTTTDGMPDGWDADPIPPLLLRPGDVVAIGGKRYRLLADVDDDPDVSGLDIDFDLTLAPSGDLKFFPPVPARTTDVPGGRIVAERVGYGNTAVDAPPRPGWTYPARYRVLRQPMPTSAEPLQLPEGTAIDLRASGIGNRRFFYRPEITSPTGTGDPEAVDNANEIVIMFAPEGHVSQVIYRQSPGEDEIFDESVVENLYLLVGRRENSPPPPVGGNGRDMTLDKSELNGKNEQQLEDMKETLNWLRSESRWIAIGAQSGRVVTVENAFVDPKAVIAKYTAPSYGLLEQTEPMRSAQILEAREFAREMTQVGGR